MLQWMGGSRRKVTTSRKSTQKRQKQYFEQRKRQQQQQDAAFTENSVDGLASCDHQKRNRSLDISSLLNVSKVREECKPSCGVETFPSMTNKGTCGSSVKEVDSSRVRKSEGNPFSASYHKSMSNPTIMPDELTASVRTVPTGTRVVLLHQVEKVSSKSPGGNTSTGKYRDSESFKSDSLVQPSIFDIIGEDGAIGTAEEEAVEEAHVAFSIEGLGKVGTETPMQSPQHLGSVLNGKKSSFTKASKNFNTGKNFRTLLDDLEMDVECLKQDDKLPSHHSLLSFSSTKPEQVTCKDGMQLDVIQLDGKQLKLNSLYDEDRHDNFWRADNSSCLVDYQPHQVNEKCGVNRKRDDAANSLFWRNDPSDFKFQKYHSPSLDSLPRYQEKIGDELNSKDEDHHVSSFNKPKYTFVHDYHLRDDLFPMKLEGTRDNLTSFSGESCSSTAVGGESTADMPSARHSGRYGKDLDMPLKSNIKDDYDEGMWNIRASKLMQGEDCKTSRKHVRSNLSHSKSSLCSRAHVSECEDYWPFEEDFPSKVDSHPWSSFAPFEKNQHCRVDSFGLDTEAAFCRSDCIFDGFEKDDEFSSENFAFHQSFGSRQSYNTSLISKPVFGEYSCEVFGDAEPAFPAPDLSAQGSAIEEGRDTPESKPACPGNKNMTPKNRLPTEDTTIKDYDYSKSRNMTSNGTAQDVTAHALEADAEETSLSNKYQHESDDELGNPTKELHGSIPVLCQQKEKGRDPGDDNLKGREHKNTLIDPCYQLMTVERYVFKLFSVPKGEAAVWNAMKLF